MHKGNMVDFDCLKYLHINTNNNGLLVNVVSEKKELYPYLYKIATELAAVQRTKMI